MIRDLAGQAGLSTEKNNISRNIDRIRHKIVQRREGTRLLEEAKKGLTAQVDDLAADVTAAKAEEQEARMFLAKLRDEYQMLCGVIVEKEAQVKGLETESNQMLNDLLVNEEKDAAHFREVEYKDKFMNTRDHPWAHTC